MKRHIALLLASLCATPALALEGGMTPTAISLEARSSGTFYVQADIAGFGSAPLLVDTGSSLTVITDAMLEQLLRAGAARFSHELAGMMADGTTRTTQVYKLAGLKLGDSCWIGDVDAAIFPSGSRAILGMNVLSRLAPFTLSMEPPALSLNQCIQGPAKAPGAGVPADAAAAVTVH